MRKSLDRKNRMIGAKLRKWDKSQADVLGFVLYIMEISCKILKICTANKGVGAEFVDRVKAFDANG